jgi:hypothetical protein
MQKLLICQPILPIPSGATHISVWVSQNEDNADNYHCLLLEDASFFASSPLLKVESMWSVTDNTGG